jgi:putative transposase
MKEGVKFAASTPIIWHPKLGTQHDVVAAKSRETHCAMSLGESSTRGRASRRYRHRTKEVRELAYSLAANCRRAGSRLAKDNTYAYRLLKAHDLITSPAYVVIKAADEFKDKTTAINQLWQTDFTYLKITGWGWYYLSTVLDDFSRFIVAWKLCATMCADDVTATLDLALSAAGLDHHVPVAHRPRLLSDNGSSYVAGDLAKWLGDKGMEHVRGAPYHPQTQGKIERWHQTLKNRILLKNYYLPGDLEQQIDAFVEHYNHVRYHESLNNLTPADVYFGRAETILVERERIKRATIANRRLQHQLQAA